MDFFVNPWFMAAGGAAIMSPILIHLINRMRFKRIRWAAMEFLLKSQKRNRRRLIIEQLILLLLRILLVLLAAFLLARYLYSGAQDEGGVKHFLVIDDSLSMTDHAKNEEGKVVSAFDTAKDEAVRLVDFTAKQNGAQEMVVYLLSDLDNPLFDGRLIKSESAEELRKKLETQKPTALHLKPAEGIEKGIAYLRPQPQKQKMLHYIGDFRDNKWVNGPEGERTSKAVDQTLDTGINMVLLDVALPLRSSTKQIANNHENVAITDIRAATRIVAEGMPVEFTVTLWNYSSGEKKCHLHVYVNGQEDFNGSKDTDSIPAYGKREVKFSLVLAKTKKAQDINAGDSPEFREQKRRAEQEFARIGAEIEGEDATGILADNYRDMVIEVRNKVPALLIDGNKIGEGTAPGGDVLHIETALQSARAYDIERRTVDELDKINFDLYPSIYLLNVAEIKNEATITRLANYVRRGGGLAIFMGDRANVPFYNNVLFKGLRADGSVAQAEKGLFPLMVSANLPPAMTPEEHRERLNNDPQAKIIIKMPKLDPEKAKQKLSTSDPLSVIVNLAPLQGVFRGMVIERYYPAQPRFLWADADPYEKVQDLIVLPNRNDMQTYKPQAQELVQSALDASRSLADGNAEFKMYADALDGYFHPQFTQVVGTQNAPLFSLAAILDRMLNDPVPKKYLENEDKPMSMKNLWDQPTMKALAERIHSMIEQVRYGDPLVVTRPFGKGRIVACMTPAGTASKWNDWGGGSPAQWTYPMFMIDLQRFLSSAGDTRNLLVGEPIDFQVEMSKYANKIELTKVLLPEVGLKPEGSQQPKDHHEKPTSAQAIIMNEFVKGEDKTYQTTLTDTLRPGMYSFMFAQQPGNLKEERLFAFNVDADHESDLRRAAREKLERPTVEDSKKGKVKLIEIGNDPSEEETRKPDASESPWMYLLILVILVVEQALAVHLSFHLRGDGTAAGAPAGAAA